MTEQTESKIFEADQFFIDEDGYGEPCIWYGKGPNDFSGSARLVVRKHALDRESVELWPLVVASLASAATQTAEQARQGNDPRTDPVGTRREHGSGRAAVKISMGDDTGKGGHVWVRLDEELQSWWMHHADVARWIVTHVPAPVRSSQEVVARVSEVLSRHTIDMAAADRAQDADHCTCGPLVQDWDEHWAEALATAGLLAAGSPVTETTKQAESDRLAEKNALLLEAAEQLTTNADLMDRMKSIGDRVINVWESLDGESTATGVTTHLDMALSALRDLLRERPVRRSGVTSETEKRP